MRTVFSQINFYNSAADIFGQDMRSGKAASRAAAKSQAPANYNVVLDVPVLPKSNFKDMGRRVVLTESETDDMKNNLFRNARANVLNLDSLVDNTNADSCFKGTIGKGGDVDCYALHTVFQTFSRRPVYITIDTPEGSGCRMSIYDKDGNQVGISEPNEDGTQTLKVPCDWSASNSFTLKIEGDQDMKEDVPYKLTFRVGDLDPEFKAILDEKKAESKTVETISGKESKKRLQEINRLRQEKSDAKIKELHEKQYGQLPAECRYLGNETCEELLSRKRRGEVLTESEETYIRIFGNLSDISETENALRFNRTLQNLRDELTKAGIDISAGTQVEISFDDKIKVSGLSAEDNERAENIIREGGFAGELRNGYLSTSETVRAMADYDYKIAMYADEMDRVLSKASDGTMRIDNVQIGERNHGTWTERYLTGLPGALRDLINNPEQYSIYEEYSRMLYRIAEYRKEKELPRFEVKIEIGPTP